MLRFMRENTTLRSCSASSLRTSNTSRDLPCTPSPYRLRAARLLAGIHPRAFTNALPFFEKPLHLKMVEHGLAVRVDAAQQREIMLVPRRNHAMQHHPVATFSKIIFQLYDQRHDFWPNPKLEVQGMYQVGGNFPIGAIRSANPRS